MKRLISFLIPVLLLLFGLLCVIDYEDDIKPIARKTYSYLYEMLGFLETEPEVIEINISDIEFQKIIEKRREAFQVGFILTKKEDYVSGTIIFKSDTINALIRLKGDYLDHLARNKWSYRIKLLNNQFVFGVDQFSIHHPGRRNHIYEWIWHELLKNERILFLDYRFIKVIINGKNLGIYAFEEHFGKTFLEKRKLEPGLVMRFDEDSLWINMATNNNVSVCRQYNQSNIDAYKTKQILTDPLLKKQFWEAKTKLDSFRNKMLPVSSVFKTDKLAKFYALSDLMAAHHGVSWHNARYYYDPDSKKFEPIGYDAEPFGTIKELSAQKGCGFMKKEKCADCFLQNIFSDSLFLKQYVSCLNVVSQNNYLSKAFDELNEPMQKKLNLLRSEFPFIKFTMDSIKRNQEFIRKQVVMLKEQELI